MCIFENNPEYFNFSAHAAIQCRAGAGVSAGKHDAKATINYKDCDEGVTQCKLSGVKAGSKLNSRGASNIKTVNHIIIFIDLESLANIITI